MREWTNEAGIACFYFEAFDEPWKDAGNPGGSENYFGLFDVNGQAKYALWDLVDQGVFNGLSRDGNTIAKTYDGNEATLLEEVLMPPSTPLDNLNKKYHSYGAVNLQIIDNKPSVSLCLSDEIKMPSATSPKYLTIILR